MEKHLRKKKNSHKTEGKKEKGERRQKESRGNVAARCECPLFCAHSLASLVEPRSDMLSSSPPIDAMRALSQQTPVPRKGLIWQNVSMMRMIKLLYFWWLPLNLHWLELKGSSCNLEKQSLEQNGGTTGGFMQSIKWQLSVRWQADESRRCRLFCAVSFQLWPGFQKQLVASGSVLKVEEWDGLFF